MSRKPESLLGTVEQSRGGKTALSETESGKRVSIASTRNPREAMPALSITLVTLFSNPGSARNPQTELSQWNLKSKNEAPEGE